MARTHGGHNFRPRVRPSSPPPATGQSTPPAAAATTSHAPIPTAPAPRRFETRVGPTPPSPAHPRPSRRAQPPTRARTSGPSESSSSRPQEPHSPPVQGSTDDLPPDLSPTSIIRRHSSIAAPLHAIQIAIPSNCTARHFPVFSADPKLRDSMRLVQRYSLEPFMIPRRLFYPRVVIEFYNTMTSKRVPHPIVIHFSIDGREGTLQATDIPAAFHFPTILANTTDYRL